MPNYKQTSGVGEAWTRAYQVIVNNQFGTTPAITFNEEEIVSLGTTSLNKHVSHLNESFSDPSVSFNLIHPVDGSVIGTATYQDLYILLSSLYSNLADKRDNPPV